MTENRNISKELMKASIYDQLSNYYKYSNPNLYIFYYQKHLKHINKAFNYLDSTLMQRNVVSSYGKIRFFHTSPISQEVDIYLNGFRIHQKINYKQITNYLTLPIGKYQIDIYPTGTMVSTILSRKINVDKFKGYTLSLIDTNNAVKLFVIEDDILVPYGETKLKFVHLSPNTPAIDIAVKKGDIVFPNLSYMQSTSHLGLSPMTVNLELRIKDTKKVILPLSSLKLNGNEIYTIFIIDNDNHDLPIEAIIIGT